MLHPFSDCPRPQKPGYVGFPVEGTYRRHSNRAVPVCRGNFGVCAWKSAIADKLPPRQVSRRTTAGCTASRFVVIEQPMFSAVP